MASGFEGSESERGFKEKASGRDLEAGVELDDELLVDPLLHLVALGQTDDGGLEGVAIQREPAGDGADAVFLELARGHLAGSRGVLDLELVAGLHVIARDVDLVAVDA